MNLHLLQHNGFDGLDHDGLPVVWFIGDDYSDDVSGAFANTNVASL